MTIAELLMLPLGEICPSAGTIVVDDVGQIFYMNPTIGIDNDDDGQADETPSQLCLPSHCFVAG